MTRQRYQIPRATTLEEILATCERHITNTRLCGADFVDNDDGTEKDFWYLTQIANTWEDLREDVQAMIDAQKK